MEAQKLNSLTYNLKPKPEDSEALGFHLRTAVGAFEGLKEYSTITTMSREPILDAKAFLRYIVYEDPVVRVAHPIIGGRWHLDELADAAKQWSFGGDHTCDTCGNIRLWGHQTYRGQVKFEPTLRCSGEKKGGNNGLMPCQDYYPRLEHLKEERDRKLPVLIEEVVAAERFKFPSKVAWRYQLTHNGYDSEDVNPQTVVHELREVVHDFESARQLFDVQDSSRKSVEDRELFLTILSQQPGFLLRSDHLKINWDISELHALLLKQERTNLLRLIEFVIEESRAQASRSRIRA